MDMHPSSNGSRFFVSLRYVISRDDYKRIKSYKVLGARSSRRLIVRIETRNACFPYPRLRFQYSDSETFDEKYNKISVWSRVVTLSAYLTHCGT